MEQAIEASVGLRAPLGRVRAVLTDAPGVVATTAPTNDERRARRFTSDLVIDLGAGTRAQQEVVVQIGLPVSTTHEILLPVHWEPTGHQHVLPTFEGELVATSGRPGTQLVLRGRYTVPLGWLGRFGDSVAGRRLARKVLGAYLEAVGERLVNEVARRASSPVSVRGPAVTAGAVGSDYFIG
jgi:hypothetical protein